MSRTLSFLYVIVSADSSRRGLTFWPDSFKNMSNLQSVCGSSFSSPHPTVGQTLLNF